MFHWALRKHPWGSRHAFSLSPFHALCLRFTFCILVYCTIVGVSSFSGQCERLSRRLVKSKTGSINANLQNLLLPVASGYATRNFDEPNYRFYSWQSHRQNYFKNSYFPRTVKIWNELPHSIKHAYIQSHQIKKPPPSSLQKHASFVLCTVKLLCIVFTRYFIFL